MSSGTTSVREQIVASLADKEYRDALVQESINQGIAIQIRLNRIERGWTQGDLGARAEKQQSEISRLEDPDYEGYTLKTLTKLASAFDVAIEVRFVPFSSLVDEMSHATTPAFIVQSYESDPDLRPNRRHPSVQASIEEPESMFEPEHPASEVASGLETVLAEQQPGWGRPLVVTPTPPTLNGSSPRANPAP